MCSCSACLQELALHAYACPSTRALICNWTCLPSRAQPFMCTVYIFFLFVSVCFETGMLVSVGCDFFCFEDTIASNHDKITRRRLEPLFLRRREPGRCRSAHPPTGSWQPFASGQYQTEWERPSREVVFVLPTHQRGGYFMCMTIIRRCALKGPKLKMFVAGIFFT